MFINYIPEEKPKSELKLKFPCTLHEIQELEDLGRIEENLQIPDPVKKINRCQVVELGKKKKSKGGLF
ncbi:hypothetical protein EBS02_00850 [bacterium]|nr:hypothetical protein [bacterium]